MNSNKKHKKSISNLVEILAKKELSLEQLYNHIEESADRFFQDYELEIELLISNGLPLIIDNQKAYLATLKRKISEQCFCIVDIETNGNNIKNGQIIEIGAVKYKDGVIIDRYESLVYAKDIPKYVQEVTNITPKMLEDAPPLFTVLEEFKLFLEDDVFIAHDIKFDYKFISDSLEKYDLGKLQNRKLCTIDLARRTIEAQRYGLDFLKQLLNIDIDNQHRAFSDALSTTYIFKESLKSLDDITVEELIKFSKSDNIIVKNEKPRKEKAEKKE